MGLSKGQKRLLSEIKRFVKETGETRIQIDGAADAYDEVIVSGLKKQVGFACNVRLPMDPDNTGEPLFVYSLLEVGVTEALISPDYAEFGYVKGRGPIKEFGVGFVCYASRKVLFGKLMKRMAEKASEGGVPGYEVDRKGDFGKRYGKKAYVFVTHMGDVAPRSSRSIAASVKDCETFVDDYYDELNSAAPKGQKTLFRDFRDEVISIVPVAIGANNRIVVIS